MRGRVVFLLAVVFLCGFRCSLPWGAARPAAVTLVSYNAHNLFDDVEKGDEYPEFKPSSGKWNAKLYEARLANTAAAVCSFSSEEGWTPDIICFQELESSKVLEDLARGALKSGAYRWIALGGPASSPIHCGILSRYPLTSLRSHALADAAGGGSGQGSGGGSGRGVGRDMLEAEIDLGEGLPRLTVFVCHWKSRKEGAEATEPARRAASRLAAARVAEIAASDPARCIVVCGDFNESPDEFARVKRAYPTALMPPPRVFGAPAAAAPGTAAPIRAAPKTAAPETAASVVAAPDAPPAGWSEGVLCVAQAPAGADLGGEVVLYSPWASSEGFSYVFEGRKERLDGFLLSPSLVDGAGPDFSRFMVSGDPALFDAEGRPLAWKGSSGYSDHLPVALVIDLAARFGRAAEPPAVEEY